MLNAWEGPEIRVGERREKFWDTTPDFLRAGAQMKHAGVRSKIPADPPTKSGNATAGDPRAHTAPKRPNIVIERGTHRP